ncbi:MAG TPA: tRNA pseudouridine(55) synthase TruB [Spirochaetota bacterium]|nr:tRNA pseudouridine(55) synthase TruB [Spirochaetota bacterium]HOM08558.1 tRNA pseudouridine(55) synthase TruB [Spirochaetota bacterium]HPP48377.1 tRNA pseudouridine(55) synthase TruB [Spirochaetota bacterium]
MSVPHIKDCVLLIDKPSGYTSFDIIHRIRKTLKVKKCGHAGTLDKFASGLLIVCLGWATRLVPFVMGMDKRYIATMQLGVATDTHDSEGQVISKSNIQCTVEDIQSCLQTYFTGEIMQVPPDYSAIKINGKRSSDRVRKGELVAIAPRPVHIHKITVIDFDTACSQLTLDITCSKGTYIRALARDLGLRLHTGAHVIALRRIAIGDFSVTDALTVEQCIELSHKNIEDMRGIVTPFRALGNFGVIAVKPDSLIKIKHGKLLGYDDITHVAGEPVFRVVPEGTEDLVALAVKDEKGYRCKKVFIEELDKIDTMK